MVKYEREYLEATLHDKTMNSRDHVTWRAPQLSAKKCHPAVHEAEDKMLS